ncbi:MAG: heparan-alpha-glucosaminide N-acetyltransferase domain-containing protein [Bryobacteraceae bacterium]|nr:heparan-alpha-glucosaminide N-acetyltransferase domain-containing protein [Bryobacteraceae bacterium]
MKERLPAPDALRGLIMVLMALDHASLLLARVHPFEMWNQPLPAYGSASWFFTRWLTHLCAPGFFLLMGAGMALLEASRRGKGWSAWQVRRFFLLRGALLAAISYAFEVTPMALLQPAGQQGMPLSPIVLGVLVTLGLSMMLAGAPSGLATGAWLALGAAAVLLPNAVLPRIGAEAAQATWALLLISPGQNALVASGYPLLPWFGICALGVGFGRLLRRDPRRALAACLPAGAALVSLFAVVRAGGGFGNLRLAEGSGWMAWLTVVKYPPSLAFASLMLGLDLLLLWALDRLRNRARGFTDVLIVYGQAPLFFYIAHFYLYGAVSMAVFRNQAAPQWLLYPLWLAGVAALYLPCRRFRDFKRKQPESSLWRML